jgi:deoxyadenosine/deoxycytidine kinase
MHDAERLKSRLVNRNRSIEILDGYEDVVEQEFTSFL